MILNKIKKNTAILAVIIFSVTTISCEKNDLENSNEKKNLILKSVQNPPSGTIRFDGKFRRGKKWSERHGVTPCTQSFGICDVKITIGKGNATLTKTSLNTSRIVFLEELGVKDGDIFISSEDDSFDMPEEVVKELGVQRLTILPKDYVAVVNSDYPYGFVDVDVNIVE